jgi:hypothetical protein
LWKSGRARGIVINVSVLIAPEDSPNKVTLRGFPPKAAMFRCTHSSAAI